MLAKFVDARRIIAGLALCAGVSLVGYAEDAAKDAREGCAYQLLSPERWGGQPLIEAPVLRPKDREVNTTLTVEYADHEIAGCMTHLRRYNGALVGPTFRVKPGDTLNINLKNMLPVDHTPPPEDINTPHNFNVTNFHTHGLHVSPTGNSDNVLISINPQSSWFVEIKIPANHPTGTFWYHAHLHGSTALQVSSGMGGAIIIENPDDEHSLDSVPEIKAAKDRTLMLQQIAYDEQGEIENYDNFGPSGWQQTQRLPTINGQVMPEIEMRPGEVQRWRLVHGGIRETFMVGIVDPDATEDPEGSLWTLNEIAVDGLSLGIMDGWKQVELQPGYRSDILVKAPKLPRGVREKVYYMMDLTTDATKSLRQVVEPQQVLAKIVVRGRKKDMKLPCVANEPCERLAITRPHKDITDEELDAPEESVVFSIGSRICPEEGKPCLPCPDDDADDCKTRFMINDIPFSTKNVRNLTLGTASEWKLDSSVANHPFHIHVNPFQVTRKNPLGEDEIVWRDTLLILQGKEQTIRSRYERYIGQFVIHCHILDHEDQGMMQIVEVVPPGGNAHH